jgi:hypothetical protein
VTLPAKKTVFVVRYSTRGGRWVLNMDYDEKPNPDRLIGDAARKRAGELHAFGLVTRTKIVKSTSLFGSDSNHIMLHFRTVTEQEQTFDTANAAAEFVRSLRRVAKERINGHDTHGIDVKTTEE